MAGDPSGDQSFYDFLIEDPEMIAPAPPGHAQHQHAIPSPNRTSRDPQGRLVPTEQETHHQANHPVHGMRLPLPDESRATSRAHLHLDLHGAANLIPHGAHPSQVAQVAHGAHGAHGVHPAQSPTGFTTATFAGQIPPATVGPMAIDWGLYAMGHPNMPINPTPFDFEVAGSMIPTATDGTIGHHGHFSQAPPTDPALAYGSDLVSPSSIHSARSHYGFAGQWDETLSHDTNTPKVTTPAATITNNPWTDPEEAPQEENQTQPPRAKRTQRSRRHKKEQRKSADTSRGGGGGGGSSSAGGGAPSLSDAASPSSTSQNSRASVGSKSASIASTTSTISNRQTKLRSASRTSKNIHSKPNDTPEDRRTRASHNLVEKQYRNRLNSQFESLLHALPEQARHGGNDGGDSDNDPDRRVSKGEVLEMARKHIELLERERNELERENIELQGTLRMLKRNTSDGTASSSGQDTPLDLQTNMEDKEQQADGDPRKG